MSGEELVLAISHELDKNLHREVKVQVRLGEQTVTLEIEDILRVNEEHNTSAVILVDLAGHVTVKLEEP